jgi:SAM-dependent methyltransferase
MDLVERSANPHRHPWELSRADMVLQLLAANARSTRYADVGSGDLYFARRLCELTDAPVYAVDVNYENPGADGQLVICTDLDQVPSGSVDCVVLMDVLEHVDDDVGLLQAVDRVLAPAGRLLITVPAHLSMWSDHDVLLGHRRRYNRRHLRHVLQRGGVKVDECFHFFVIPYLARAVIKGLSSLGVRKGPENGVGHWPYALPHPITRTLRAMLNSDFRISRLLGPWAGCGLTICAICRRTSA